MKKYICRECNKKFKSFQLLANHVRWNHINNDVYKKKASIIAVKVNELKYGKWIVKSEPCHKCNKSIKIKFRQGKKKSKYFCSRRCSNIRIHSKKTKQLISKKVSNLWKSGFYDETSALNFIALKKQFSSKTERIIVKHFKQTYPNDKWTSGGRICYKEKSFSRDMYSDKLKICFEYDGIWHFKDIHGQLINKKLKDMLLEEWCHENNYRLVRIDENDFIDVNQIEKLIYDTNEKVIKIGSRY